MAEEPDHSKSKAAVWIPILLAIGTMTGSAFTWGYNQYADAQKEIVSAKKAEAAENERLLREYLVPIETKLNYTQSVFKQLNSGFVVQGYGILESYVVHANRGDKQAQALAFPLITDLVKQDAEISSLVENYLPNARSENFRQAARDFLEHAHTYIIRVQALPNIISTGAPLPSWKPFPQNFPIALREEIAIRRDKRGS